MEIIDTKKAPGAIGPYSQAIKANGFIFVSGQIPLDPTTNELKTDVYDATIQSLTNIKNILLAGNSDMSSVVKVNIFLTDMNDFAKVNEAYNTFFVAPYPARACVAVKTLPKNAVLEIEAIATYER